MEEGKHPMRVEHPCIGDRSLNALVILEHGNPSQDPMIFLELHSISYSKYPPFRTLVSDQVLSAHQQMGKVHVQRESKP